MTPTSTPTPPQTLRVLSFLESNFVTGPAKCVFQFAQAARLADSDLPLVDLSMATFTRPTDGPNGLIDGARLAGLPVHVLSETGPFDRSLLPKVRSLVHSLAPDLIETHHVKSHFLIALSGLGRTYPWVAFHHGYTATSRKQRLYNHFDRWSLRQPGHLVAVCGPFKKQLTRFGLPPERISVLHNAIEPWSPDPAAIAKARTLVPPGLPILLMVGRLSREKGHLDFVSALALLHSRHPQLPWHALLVGEGPERAALTESLARAGLSSRVTLAGLHHDIKPFYGLADLFVMPSHSEGSPLALLEAMISEVPIIASSVGGIPEIVTDQQHARLVPPSDPATLADALAELLANPSLGHRFAAAAYRRAFEHHRTAVHRRRLAAIHLQVLRQKGSPALAHAS